MPAPSKEEKDAENKMIIDFCGRVNAKVVELQSYEDNGGTDGIIEFEGKKISVEARRKGYPNHSGKSTPFKKGWKTDFLINDKGIFLNESTIENHKEKGFVFIVDIKGGGTRACTINQDRVNELLQQPPEAMRSTNSGVMQSVKRVPLDWFKRLH